MSAALAAGALAAAPSALGATLCVDLHAPGCFGTIQAAVDAAQDGDRIELGAGTFAGGITLDEDVALVGAGSGATRIAGGGPVLTIGEHLAAEPPTVSVERLTITGGVSRAGFAVGDDFAGIGGGIYVPPSEGFATGAALTLDHVVVTGNRAEPATTFPFACTPTIACRFGYAEAGGISNFGQLTVRDSRVTDNDAGGGVTSFASGAGILNHVQGTLTIERSVISGNRIRVARPNAIFGSGGGVTTHGRLAVSDSIVSDNSVEVAGELPDDVSTASFTGGIEVTNVADATIVRTIVRGNSVRMTNVGGSVRAGVGGISTDEGVSLVLRDSTIASNSVHASATSPASGATAFAGGIELEGAIEVSRARVIGNEVRAETPAGFTGVAGGGIEAEGQEPVRVADSIVVGNRVTSVTAGGFAVAVGGGIANGGLLSLKRVVVSGNSAAATGPAGFAQGGGIQSWVIPLPGAPQVVELTLADSVVTGNRIEGSPGVDVRGGGIFASSPLTLTDTVVAGNKPDQCVGC